MIKNKTVLIGVITAMLLSTSTAYANDEVQDFYRYIVQSETGSNDNQEIISLIEEVLQKDVAHGRITSLEAKIKLEQLKQTFES